MVFLINSPASMSSSRFGLRCRGKLLLAVEERRVSFRDLGAGAVVDSQKGVDMVEEDVAK